MTKGKIAVFAVAVALSASLAAVADAATATGSPSSPLNLSDNPVLATGLGGWATSAGGSALTRIGVTDHVAASAAAETVSSANTTRVRAPAEPVTPGRPWTFAADVEASQSTAKASVSVEWYTPAGAFLSYDEGTFVAVEDTRWTRTVVTATPPTGAGSARTQVNVTGTAKNATVRVTQHDVRGPTSAPPPGAITNRPPQSASLMWGDLTAAQAAQYAHPGAVVAAGRDNYGAQTFKNISAAGGSVLIYLDPIIDNAYGRYHQLLDTASECGPAVARWPGGYRANSWGYLNDFRPGGTLQTKLDCVLEKMVTENPHMAGWFMDDVGSRSWYPDIDWSAFPDKQLYRDGAIQITETVRRVADRHGLIFIVNGTWSAGSLAASGGGYPDMNQHGNALADGGFIEHHGADQLGFFGPYACSSQWAARSGTTHGTSFQWAVTETAADRRAYVDNGCFALVNEQTTDDYDFAPPWGSFHPTGLPNRVLR